MTAGIYKVDFSSPDKKATAEKTIVEVVNVGSTKIARLTAQPGWIWSECIGSIVGNDSCQEHHLGIVQSGQLLIQHEDGSEETVRAGDVYVCKPDHDGRVVGDEPFVMIEFDSQTADSYVKE